MHSLFSSQNLENKLTALLSDQISSQTQCVCTSNFPAEYGIT